MRRISIVAGLLAVLVLGTAGAAMAYIGELDEPNDSTFVTANQSVSISVERECTGIILCNPEAVPKKGDVQLQLRRGTTPVGSSVDATCIVNCSSDDNLTSTWAGPTIKPSGSPWTLGCNGEYQLRALVKGTFEDGETIQFLQPPAPPPNFVAGGTVGNVNLSWGGPAAEDVFGVVIAREAKASGTWVSLTPEALKPNQTTFHDPDVTAADLPVAYRVAFLRHDGLVDGDWVDACADTATTLEEVFATGSLSVTQKTAIVADPSASPSPAESGSANPSEDPSEDPSGPEPTSEPSSAERPTDTPTSPGGDADRPQPPTISLPDRPPPDVHYYGEDLGFNEELDFGGVETFTDPLFEDFGEDGELALDVEVPTTRSVLDDEAIVKPVALGFLLLTLGMHVYRWMLEP